MFTTASIFDLFISLVESMEKLLLKIKGSLVEQNIKLSCLICFKDQEPISIYLNFKIPE